MPKCPYCNEEITYLNYEIVKTISGTYSIDKDGFDEYDEDILDYRSELYFCPECEKEIKDVNVYDFLKGEVKK